MSAQAWAPNLPQNVPPMLSVAADRGLDFRPHEGQWDAWLAQERIIALVAGTQSGKTTFGPLWLEREIQICGPGVYLIAAPTDPLLQVKLIPEFRRLFEDMLQLGTFYHSPRPKFVVSREGERRLWGKEQDEQTIVYFGYAAKPDSLESMTIKAAWLDEAGQPEFKVGSWEAILRRLSLSMGRILITTTPYTIAHWLKRRVFDKRHDPRESIRVIQFKSIWNPAFPRAEWERAKRDLPPWKFRMMYCGDFSKPAGQIYDCVQDWHRIPRVAIPARAKRYIGLDFGGVNFAGVFLYERTDGALVVYKTYRAGHRTMRQHKEAMLRNEPPEATFVAYGGAKSEQVWRDELKAAGLLVKQPVIADVEIGINRVYAQYVNNRLFVFDDLEDYLDELDNYTRKVDDVGEVSETIENKNEYHLMDGTRYIVGSVRTDGPRSGYTRTEPTYVDDVDVLSGYYER